MFRSGIFTVLCLTTACSFGFTKDRSAYLLFTRAPSLDSYQRILVDSMLSSNMQVTSDTDKTLQVQNAKLTDGISKSQRHEKRWTTEYIDAGTTKNVNNIASAMKNNTRNVILFLIDKVNEDERKEEDLWQNYKENLPFAIEGFLQDCGNKTVATSFPLNSALISDDNEKDYDCDCQRILHSSVEELLSWARHMRGMTTGMVSDSDFSIPSFSRSELDGSNKSDAKLELRKSKRDNIWQIFNFSNQAKSVPPLVTVDSESKEATNYSMWEDLFDVFSKIRMAFFRSLLESFGKNDHASENRFSSLFSLKPTIINLIENMIKKFKSTPNNKGYMLIATVPRSELDTAVALVQNETSSKDTLLVMMRMCTRNKSLIPFVAQGLNNQILREARTISELLIAIRKAVVSDCHGLECTKRLRRDISIISSVPIEIFSQKLSARKRSSRDKDATKKLDVVLSTEKATKSSTPLKATPYSLTTAIGVVTSIFATATLISS